MPRPDPPVPGPGAQTFLRVPKSPADAAEPLDDGWAEEAPLLLVPPLGVEELDRPQDATSTLSVAATATTPTFLERCNWLTGKEVSTPSWRKGCTDSRERVLLTTAQL